MTSVPRVSESELKKTSNNFCSNFLMSPCIGQFRPESIPNLPQSMSSCMEKGGPHVEIGQDCLRHVSYWTDESRHEDKKVAIDSAFIGSLFGRCRRSGSKVLRTAIVGAEVADLHRKRVAPLLDGFSGP
jgi:hypothetical protein